MVELGAAKKLSEGMTLPFPAVVGQAELKTALLALGANDALDGLLIRGEKGTAKSTAARGLPDLLPEQSVVADCPFGCPPNDSSSQCENCRERESPPVETRPVPFVTLPLGASRERVVGTLSVADALEGSAEFEPGLLARANRGFLYVDEVNLLDDHLVDVLLDAAASGVNRVERDGISVGHPADITLIGTMNPEEGDLRPQFRDRFGLQVEVQGSDDIDDRVAVVERALDEPDEEYDEEKAELRERLRLARDRLSAVTMPESLLLETAQLCREAGVEGHRADIATARTARTLAALESRERVIEPDVRQAATFALPHRLKSQPFEDAPDPEEIIDDHFEDDSETQEREEETESQPDEQQSAGEGDGDTTESGRSEPDDATGDRGDGGDGGNDSEQPTPAGESDSQEETDGSDSQEETDDNGSQQTGGGRPTDDQDSDQETATPIVPGQSRADIGAADAPDLREDGKPSGPRTDQQTSGRRPDTPTPGGSGARVRTVEWDADGSIDAAASVRAAATRGDDTVESRDLRQSVRTSGQSALVVFALDASASMRGPMRAAKGVVMELLADAYEQRDEVAVVTFAGEDADVLLPPTDSVSMAARHLKELPTADRTPLAAGLQTTGDVLERADPAVGVVVLVTDGRANAGTGSPTTQTRRAAKRLATLDAHVLVVDAGTGTDRSSLTCEVTSLTAGDRVSLDALTAQRVESALARHGSSE
ncbi:VWA domain-containing protein [Halovenus salina]|uniref:VWA domain-containing protein n=1 Tax=Halovenus salina TaxID=1510225 RepID=A0ABD5W4I2_9EURY|nr:VWA domain-containing protein [Halovenus salina]